MSEARPGRKQEGVRRSGRITEMANAADDNRFDPSSGFDYNSSDEETLNLAIESGGDRSSSGGKGGKGGVCPGGCSSSADSSSDNKTLPQEDLLTSDEPGGAVKEGTPELAERVKDLAIEEKRRFDAEEKVEAAALGASEAKEDEKAAIKNKGKKAALEEADPNEEAIATPEPLEPSSFQAQGTLHGVFFRSTDDSACYKPFPTGIPDSLPAKVSINFLPEPVHVVASSYGLLCCFGRFSRRYYACNPTTMNCVMIPQPPDTSNHGDGTEVALVFEKPMRGCHFESDYHMVCAYPVKGFDLEGYYAFDVFSSKTGQWTASMELCCAELLLPTSGVGVAGKACWTTTMNTAVIFDPDSDKLQAVPWPVGYPGGDVTWSLAELQGELCAVCVLSSGTDVYALENNSDGAGATWATFVWRKKWEKVGQVPASACPLPGQSTTEVLFKNGNELLAVDVITGTSRAIGGDDEPIIGDAFLPYTSSLVGVCGPDW